MKDRILLVSPPWPLFNRPSIQLGALKAFLSPRFPDVTVEARHPYLALARALGYPLYQAVSERTWTAEPVFAALLYPERRDEIAAVFRKEGRSGLLRRQSFEELVEKAEAVSNDFLETVEPDRILVAGFSVCFAQLTAALYLTRRLKADHPSIPVVAGGSLLPPATARGLLGVFPEIDAVVAGEGELPLARIVSHLRSGGKIRDLSGEPGIITADSSETVTFHQVPDLSLLPAPDYADYFAELSAPGSGAGFFPTLPVEHSRGCWWRSGGHAGCAFCNLNLQWEGYRAKPPAQMAAEIDGLTTRHRVLTLAFTDNVLPAGSQETFSRLAALEKDFQILGEIRAETPTGRITALAAAGGDRVQVGIEALSTPLLERMGKGTTAIQNLAVMVRLEEAGLDHTSNLLLEFPGSGPDDVAETLRVLSFARPLRPLETARFWLGLDSPVARDPAAFGITAVFNHPHYARLFPPALARSVRFMIQEYRGDRGAQRRLWAPVRKAVREWERFYGALHREPGAGPILGYRDGGAFLIIRERRLGKAPAVHRLEGKSREIYLFCRQPRTLDAIRRRFPEIPGDSTSAFLRMMAGKRLMFSEDESWLSLAVRVRKPLV